MSDEPVAGRRSPVAGEQQEGARDQEQAAAEHAEGLQSSDAQQLEASEGSADAGDRQPATGDRIPDLPTGDPRPATGDRIADDEVLRDLRRVSRRGFVTFGAGALAAYGAWKWLRLRPKVGGVEWPLRDGFQFNEKVAEAYFSPARHIRTFPPSKITVARINGGLGLNQNYDTSTWRLQVLGGEKPVTLTLDDIRSLPRQTMITELRCIEGWSIVVKWTGARLADLMSEIPPLNRDGSRGNVRVPSRLVRYVAMETPDRGYYVGLDMQSALHPQTLLAYELNDRPLTWQHGSPLRLAIPIKYGVKNIKRVSMIRYTDVRPADFWAEQGYDWYLGH